jgi:hypothetical protein
MKNKDHMTVWMVLALVVSATVTTVSLLTADVTKTDKDPPLRVTPAAVESTTTTAAPTPTTLVATTTAPTVRQTIVTTTTVFRGDRCESSDPAITDCGTTANDSHGWRTAEGGCVVTDSSTGEAYGLQRDDTCFNPASGTAASG